MRSTEVTLFSIKLTFFFSSSTASLMNSMELLFYTPGLLLTMFSNSEASSLVAGDFSPPSTRLSWDLMLTSPSFWATLPLSLTGDLWSLSMVLSGRRLAEPMVLRVGFFYSCCLSP